MDLPALADTPLPAATELAGAALLWAFATLLALGPAPESGGRRADRMRRVVLATAVGAGHWAALLCVIAGLTGVSAARVAPLPLGAALLLAAVVAGLPAPGTAPWSRGHAIAGIIAGGCGLGVAALLLGLAVGVQQPPPAAVGALALSLGLARWLLARAQRNLAGEAAALRRRATSAVLVTAGAGAPIVVLVIGLPVLVSSQGSTGAPMLIAAFALVTMAIAAASRSTEAQPGAATRRRKLRACDDDAQDGGASNIDPLTSLPTRDGFTAWLAAAMGRTLQGGDRITLLVVGIDGFKKVNDAFGRRGGDLALAEIARRIGAACRSLPSAFGVAAHSLGRTGGDEFAAALQGRLTREDASRAAAHLLEAIGARVTIDGSEVGITASIGVACAPEDGVGTTLLAHAEEALRAAKENGGAGYALFDVRLVDETRTRLELLRDLRRAVEERQLELLYQPKIDAKSGQVTAAEALLRWRHPTRGMISPAVFIPLAERYGLIGELGNWVIEDACRQARVWRKVGLKMRVAINLSAYQMRQDDLVERIHAALDKHRIDPSRLTCEITETVAMEDTQVTQRTFERLGEAGIHLSIDDFGTGYSSLAYLRRLPAAELKIDRAFVKDLGASDDARAIVDAVVKMAHAIGLRVVAEGVETIAQRDVLMDLGCDELQGYLFAKPMSARAILLWAVHDKPQQHAFRPSLFVNTDTAMATQLSPVARS